MRGLIFEDYFRKNYKKDNINYLKGRNFGENLIWRMVKKVLNNKFGGKSNTKARERYFSLLETFSHVNNRTYEYKIEITLEVHRQ